MNGLDHSCKLLLYAQNKLLAFSLNTSLSPCGTTDSVGFPLMFHKYKCKRWQYSEKKKKPIRME